MKAQGRLIYLIGPSGAGKDSLISYARKNLNGERSVMFAHRYITRPPLANDENHIALSDEEFMERLKKGIFAMHWQSHSFHYGIGAEIDLWLWQQCKVVVNGSRSYMHKAIDLYPFLEVVLLDVSENHLKHRLAARGRETMEEIEMRLEHNRQIKHALKKNISNLSIINNDGPIESAGEQFLKQLH
jgi:ribose 1,5-bisphosphokinase